MSKISPIGNAKPWRWRTKLLKWPLEKFGLTWTQSNPMDDYECRSAKLSAALAQTEQERASADADYEKRLTDLAAETALRVAEYETRIRRAGEEIMRLEQELDSLHRRLTPAAGLPLPVYLTPDFCPAAQPIQGASPHRIVVCSIPKAGTYLVSRLLELLGCAASQLHVSTPILTDYRFATMREAREDFERLLRPVPLERSIALLLPGQFTVGHLECSEHTRRALASVKKLFVYRNVRDGAVSFLRFLAATGRGGEATRAWKDLPAGPEQMLRFLNTSGQDYFNMVLPALDWLDQPDVFFLQFETLYGDHGQAAQQALIEQLRAFLALPGELGDLDALRGSLFGAPTMTWSGKRATRGDYWNDTVEQRFADLGGVEANRRLGYETATGAERSSAVSAEATRLAA